MSGDGKRRWPRATAMGVALSLVEKLQPVCERIEIAGSLRRGKKEVGDVEIVYVPKFGTESDGLFDTVRVNLADNMIGLLMAEEHILPRKNALGRCSWGAKIKLANHWRGVPVDLFATETESWWNYLVCRTGPTESNLRIARAAQAKGWKWEPYSPGFRRGAEVHACGSERDVFEFVGLPYAEPEERR